MNTARPAPTRPRPGRAQHAGELPRVRVVAAGVGALAVALLGAASAPILANGGRPQGDASAEGVGFPCTEASVGSCGLPYPSDEFTVADQTSPTGVRLAVPEDLLGEGIRNALGPGASPHDAFDGADGFSALSPVIFQVDAPVRGEALPADGGDVFVVYDEASGERQEIRAEVWPDAAWRGAPNTILMAWPVTRWEYGHRYLARLSSLKGLLPIDPKPPAALSNRSGHLGALLERLGEIEPDAQDQLLSVTGFTVGSRQSAVGGLEKMAWIAGADDHPVRNLESRPPLFFEHGAAIVTGEVRITDFRDPDGVVDADRAPTQTWIPFLLALPDVPASPEGAPVVVYGHGLMINKESMLIVASHNAAKGVATIGIDVPNHGGRQAGQGGFLLDLTNPRSLGRLVGMPEQGIVDHVSLVQAIIDHLGALDLSPWNVGAPPGDGRPDLDTSLLLYEGTSMGSVLGVAAYALAPELDAAFLQVPGVGILDILTHSMLWPLFMSVIPAGADAGDAATLIGAASMLIDGGDATHLLDELADSGRPVVAQVGVGDSIVPEFASNRLVRMLDLPRIGQARTGISATSNTKSLAEDGRGFAEVWPQHSSPASMGFMAHLTFSEPATLLLLDEWLDQRLAAAGVAQP